MSLSLSLLTIFSKETCFGSDIKAFVERSQVLSIIYINFSIFLMVLGYEMSSWIFLGPSNYYAILTLITFPCATISLAFLKIGKKEISASILLGYMHFMNFFATHIVEIPMAALHSLIIFPTFCFFLTSSNKIYSLNAALCLANLAYYHGKIRQIFDVTVNERQSTQIHTFLLATIVVFIAHFSASYVQKGLEKNLWKLAQSHYDKSKALMIDILDAAKAKEEYADLLSKLILYPVNMMNSTVDQLLERQSDPDQRQLLGNAKITTNILLNMIHNMFNLPKLKPAIEKTELTYSDMDIVGTIKRALMLNSDNIKKHNSKVRVFISENLPSKVWTDSPFYLHLMIAQMLDTTRHIAKDSKIQVVVNWEHENQTKEALLTPDEDYIVRDQPAKTTNDQEERNSVSPTRRKSTSQAQSYADLQTGEFTSENPSRPSRNMIRTSIYKRKWPLENSTMSQGELWEIFRFRAPFDRSRTSSQLLNCSLDSIKEKIPQRGYLKVQVSYLGAEAGLSQEEITKLFDNTCQSYGMSNDGSKTTHLGLWISRQMSLKLGGDLKAYSQPGQATTCVFYIPVNMNQKAALAPKVRSTPRDRASALIIDGYTSTRELYKLQLERKGVMVTAIATNKEALERFKTREEDYFDFIMIDIQTTEQNGFETIKAIREWETIQQRKKVDIYVMSDEFDSEEEVLSELRRRTGGIISIEGIKSLRKPIPFEVINDLISRYNKDHKKNQDQENKKNFENRIFYTTSDDSEIRFRKNT